MATFPNQINIQACVFDLDGTVVDSYLDFDLMRKQIGIPEGSPILEYLDSHPDRSFAQNAYKIVHQHELDGATKAICMRDFREFYNFLKSRDIPLGLLTRNSKAVTELTLKKLNLQFDYIYSRDCCRPKPDPEGLNIISSSLKVEPQNILYVGDHHYDLLTAQNANMPFALILHAYNEAYQDQAMISFTYYFELKKIFGETKVNF